MVVADAVFVGGMLGGPSTGCKSHYADGLQMICGFVNINPIL